MSREIDCDTTSLIRCDRRDDATPQQAVGQQAVHEHGRTALAHIEITDRARGRRGLTTVGLPCRNIHRDHPSNTFGMSHTQSIWNRLSS